MRMIYKRYFYEELSKHSNLPHFDTCPLPAGQYEIKEYQLDMAKFKGFRYLFAPGQYRLQQFLIENDVTVTGILFYGRIVEKS